MILNYKMIVNYLELSICSVLQGTRSSLLTISSPRNAISLIDSHDVGHSSNNSVHGEGGITSESGDKYWEYLLKVICDDAGHVANSSLKQSDTATPSSKEFAECINYDSMNDEQHNGHVRTENVLAWQTVEYCSTSQQLQVSSQLSQLHTCGGEPEVISTEQNVLHASTVLLDLN
ncbi:hypothetical protein POM88_041557 [Heracleum sosnowskyi]|uniref:Uncharacterized protein n=1 Tax=Heracleum sosnowskyi TaxID=360622 RepID=A0AAD8HGD5_9APIA|nr:hypothetical protein POM88_041557 [Heracleum sosnowskyi]